ncbi:hypothetical protein G6F31_021247 [Rhizopus arrhizus]|nr:hypothetical protein G6F31_021247 [Rhizopus arrhizus]
MDRIDDVAGGIRLAQYANVVVPQQGPDQCRGIDHGQDRDTQLGVPPPQHGNQGESVAILTARHGVVGDQHIARLHFKLGDQVSGILGASDNVDRRIQAEFVADAQGHCRVIVGNNNANIS